MTASKRQVILARHPYGVALPTLLLVGGILLILSRLRHAPAKATWGTPLHQSGSIAPQKGVYLADGTKRMAERLQHIADARDLSRADFASGAQRIGFLQDCLAQTNPPNIRLSLIGQLAEELLNAGRTEDALKAYDDYTQLARTHYPDFYRKELQWMTDKKIAMCYLRLGEQQNCCANNNTNSCLLPIRGGGIHTKQFGSQEGASRLVRLQSNAARFASLGAAVSSTRFSTQPAIGLLHGHEVAVNERVGVRRSVISGRERCGVAGGASQNGGTRNGEREIHLLLQVRLSHRWLHKGHLPIVESYDVYLRGKCAGWFLTFLFCTGRGQRPFFRLRYVNKFNGGSTMKRRDDHEA